MSVDYRNDTFLFLTWKKIQNSLEFKKMLSDLRSLFFDISYQNVSSYIKTDRIVSYYRKNKHIASIMSFLEKKIIL